MQETIIKPDFQEEQREINRIGEIAKEVLDMFIHFHDSQQNIEYIREILLHSNNNEHYMIKDRCKSIVIDEFNRKYKPDISNKHTQLLYRHALSNDNRIIYILKFYDNPKNESIYNINHKNYIIDYCTLLRGKVDNLITKIIEQEIAKEDFQRQKQEINRIREITQDLWNQFIDYFNSQEYKEFTEKVSLSGNDNQHNIIYSTLASNFINEFNNKYRLKIGHQYPTYSLSELQSKLIENKEVIRYKVNPNNNFTSQSIYGINHEREIRGALQFLVTSIYVIIIKNSHQQTK